MLIIILLLIASFLIVSAALLMDAYPHNRTVPLLLVWAFVFFLMAFWIDIASVSAAENSAPAESAITVKGYTSSSCPTEFNPDDLGWAMHDIKYDPKKFEEDVVVMEHRRIFSYFPDAEQRIFVGMKKWKNPVCVAELFSYGPTSGTNQKRVWSVIRSSDGTGGKTTTVFLLTDKGWEKGGADMPKVLIDYSAEQYNIVFVLYRDKIQVASRALPVEPVKRFFHFQFNEEPVE